MINIEWNFNGHRNVKGVSLPTVWEEQVVDSQFRPEVGVLTHNVLLPGIDRPDNEVWVIVFDLALLEELESILEPDARVLADTCSCFNEGVVLRVIQD